MFECFNPGDECCCSDLIRSFFYIILPALLLLAGSSNASQDFQAYRMQQYDLLVAGSAAGAGTRFGSRSASFSMEAARASQTAAGVSRRCVLIHLDEFTLERYRSLVANYVGAIVVILPKTYKPTHRAIVSSLEANLLHEEVSNGHLVFNSICIIVLYYGIQKLI